MKKIILLVGILVINVACFAQVKFNDENAELREAKNFHGIEVSNAFDVYISQGSEEAVAVSASEEKYKQQIVVEVKEGILHVYYDWKGKGFWKGFNTGKMKLKAYISFKQIDKLVASGACDIHLQGTLTAENFNVNLSGASDWKDDNGKLAVSKNLSVDVSGASRMRVTGSAQVLNVEASGASDFKGFDFNTDICDADASGASSINITVNKELSARASGASSVRYKGDGVITNIKTSGASNVRKS